MIMLRSLTTKTKSIIFLTKRNKICNTGSDRVKKMKKKYKKYIKYMFWTMQMWVQGGSTGAPDTPRPL